MELDLDVNEVARSLHSAWAHATRGLLGNDVPPISWDALPLEEQATFLAVASRGERIIERMEGQTLSQVGFALFQASRPNFEEEQNQEAWAAIGFLGQTMWEAIARHMAMLVDCDEVIDLEQAEGQWYEWAKRKLAKAQQPKEQTVHAET